VKRALALVLMLFLVAAAVVAADAFPLSNKQPLPAGVGWRVVYADFPADPDHAYRVGLATDRETYHALWTDVGRTTVPPPQLDLGSQVVALFAVGAGSCTTAVSLRTVVFDHERRIVYAEFSERTCGLLDLHSSAVFLVAIARDRLPSTSFTLQLRRDRLCAGCPDGMTVDF
jgi:hypothetical protein